MRTNAPAGAPTNAAPNPIFPSLSFPPDRKVLLVSEVSSRLSVSDQHVLDLIKEGKISAVDLAGKCDWVRMPAQAIDALAARFNVSRAVVLKTIADTKPVERVGRHRLRIPVKEGYEAFLRENLSGR